MRKNALLHPIIPPPAKTILYEREDIIEFNRRRGSALHHNRLDNNNYNEPHPFEIIIIVNF